MKNKCFSFPCRVLDEEGRVIAIFAYLNRLPLLEPELMYQELLSVLPEDRRVPMPVLFGVRTSLSSEPLIEALKSLEEIKTEDGKQVLKVRMQEIEDTINLKDWQRAIYERFQVEETKGCSLDVSFAGFYYV